MNNDTQAEILPFKLQTEEHIDLSQGITKPSLIRLSRRAGVKSVSESCYEVMRELIVEHLTEIIKLTLITNSEHQTRTIMVEDVYKAVNLLGYVVAHSNDLGTTTYFK